MDNDYVVLDFDPLEELTEEKADQIGENDAHLLEIHQKGWVPFTETLTYASASTFTISGDVTDKIAVGDFLKLSQTTVKYFNVVKVAYSAPNTTITVTGGSDYALANAVITDAFFAHKKPPGFPAYFNWSASHNREGGDYTNDPSNNYGHFKVIGNLCFFKVRFTQHATVIGGSGRPYFSLPLEHAITQELGTGFEATTNLDLFHVYSSDGLNGVWVRYDGSISITANKSYVFSGFYIFSIS